jgi:DNA (cytosine-5)-methyltransferase 1
MFGKYTHGKLIPEWVQDAPKEFIQDFINGYMKAVGNITKNGSHQITSVSPNLILGTQRLYFKLGYILSISKTIRPKQNIIKGRIVNQRDTYRIIGQLKDSRYTTFIEGNYAWFPLAKTIIENVDNIPVYNFEVNDDNSYIVENTIVHNCQAWSQSGARKGLEDPRGDLMLKFADLIEKVKPKMFMIENVKGLLSHNEGDSLKKIIINLNKNNLYNIVYKVLNAVNFGVPQKRERVFIIGMLKSENIKYEFPKPDERIITVGEALRNVPISEGALYSDSKKEYFTMVPEGGCWVNLPEDKQREYMMASFDSGGGKRGILHRLSNSKPSLTLLCTPSQKQTERCHPTEIRPLRIREYARIQSFPDDYEFVGSMASKYKQIGNAVPVELARRVGLSLIKALYKPIPNST